MPAYDYSCDNCRNVSEIFHSILENPEIVCQKCGGKCVRQIGQSRFILKGRGWAADGYSNSKESNNGNDP